MSDVRSLLTDPALRRVRMRIFTAVIVVFTLVCSGSFGMEDVVSGSGPGFTILMICLLPFVWSIPMALVASELGSAIPEGGGFYRWVRRAMGEYWSFQTGWWWTLSLYVDSAVYITLALGYIQSKWGISDDWRWVLGIGLVAFFTFINIRGLDLTGKALTVIQIIVMAPFVALVIWGFAKGTGNPISPMLPPHMGFVAASSGGLAIMMWMYSGYESMSTLAAEVENPQRLIPRAIMIAVPVVIITYALTTMAAVRAAGSGNWVNLVSDASGGGAAVDFVKAGQLVGGAVLLWAVFASAIASNLGLYAGYLASGSRPSYQLSRDRLYPRFMGKVHKSWGTPWVAILIMGLVDAVLVKGSFTTLIVIDVFLLMFSYIPIFIAAVVLRWRQPELPRPFRVPLPTWLLFVYVLFPIAIAVYALFTNGADYLVGGLIGVISGPVAYLVFKQVYKGTADDALEGAMVTSIAGSFGTRTESRRASARPWRLIGAALGVAAGIAAVGAGLYVHGAAGYRLGLAWRIGGGAVSAPRLLVAMGVVMIVGGLLTARYVVIGGLLTALALVPGLVFAYDHVWYRMADLHVWAAAVVLALLSCVCAGVALQREIVPVGAEPLTAPLALPVEELGEPLVVGAPPSV